MSKLLTVFGATGMQGGSVIKTVLGHPQLSKQFRIRAITRDPSKPSGKALSDQGVDVVKVCIASISPSLVIALIADTMTGRRTCRTGHRWRRPSGARTPSSP
jgi:uncharacterized protein YbjT (DUF2867 family)